MIKFLNIKQHKAEVKRLKFVMKFQDQLNSLVKTVKDRARNEIFDNSYYREINVPIQNKDKNVYCRSLVLTISQDSKNKANHLLEVAMLHPTMMIENKRPIAMGNKAEILQVLENKDFITNLSKDISEMSEKLKSI